MLKERNEAIGKRWYDEMWSKPDLGVADEIIDENYRSFKLNTAFVNNSFNYLKYEDKIREITILFFNI